MVIFESTVYPGATEDVCVPILECESGLRFNANKPGPGFAAGLLPTGRAGGQALERRYGPLGLRTTGAGDGTEECCDRWRVNPLRL